MAVSFALSYDSLFLELNLVTVILKYEINSVLTLLFLSGSLAFYNDMESGMFDLTGKSAVVTGGASGIGEAIAARFKAAGAKVLVADIIDDASAVIAAGHAYYKADVSDPKQVAAMFDKAIELHGSLDIVVNNAGIAVTGGIMTTGTPEADRLWQVNTMGVVHGIREAAKRMPNGGSIINTASLAGWIGMPELVDYSMGKAAIIQATKTSAIDLGLQNIRVNAMCPGIIVTPLGEAAGAPISKVAAMVTVLGRSGNPSDVAVLAHFLASDDASYITGQAIAVDGGWNIGTTAQVMAAGVAAAK
jgi:NAD(P)-dependent dehydrogenase (short-subunit alcohol dehydrogenase family)